MKRKTFNEADLAGLLYGFASYLTTLPKSLTVSSKHFPGSILKPLQEYAKMWKIPLDKVNHDWFKDLGGNNG